MSIQSGNWGGAGTPGPPGPPGPAGAITVTSIPELANYGVGLPNGTVAHLVGNRNSRWVINAGSANEAAGPSSGWISFAGSNDPGRIWYRDLDIGTPGATYQNVWYIDSATGDDNNLGNDPLLPIKTFDEFTARIGQQNVAKIITVYVTGDIAGRDPFDWELGAWVVKFNTESSGSGVGIVGQRTVLATYTLSGVVPWDDATGTPGNYTIAGLPDLVALGYDNKWVRVSGGPRDGIKCRIAKVTGLGSFRGNFGDQTAFGAAEPQVGDTIEIFSLPTFGNVDFVVNVAGDGYVAVESFDVGQALANHSTKILSGNVYFVACEIHGLDIDQNNYTLLDVCATHDCRTYSILDLYATTHFSAGGTALAARKGGVIEVNGAVLVQGYGVNLGHATEGSGHMRVAYPLNILDYSSADAVLVFPGSTLVVNNWLWCRDANGATCAYHVLSGGGIYYDVGLKPASYPVDPATFALVGGTVCTSVGIPFFSTTNGAAFVVYQ